MSKFTKEITSDMNNVIDKFRLVYKIALPKKILTHIAVSKVYSQYWLSF